MRGPAKSGRIRLRVGRALTAHTTALDLSLLALVATVMRVALATRAPVFIDGDSTHYYQPAYELFTSGSFPLGIARQPLYPLFIASLARLFGESLERLVAVQHLLGLGSAWLTYAIGRLTFGRSAAWLAGLAIALSSGQLVYEQHIMSETLSTFLLLLATCLLLVGLRSSRPRWLLAGGVAVGLATLARPQAQILLALVPLVALCSPRPRPALVRTTALVAVGAAIVLAPWVVRNWLVHRAFAVSAGSGQQIAFRAMSGGSFVFLDKENPPADQRTLRVREELQDAAGSVEDDENKPATSIVKINAYLERELGLSEAEVDALLRDAALEAISAQPLTYVRLVLADTWRNLAGTPDDFAGHWRGRPPANSRLNDLATRVSPQRSDGFPLAERLAGVYQSARLGPLLVVLFALGTSVALLTRERRLALLPALTAVACQLGSAALAFHLPRYQYYVEPLVHVVAAGGIVALVGTVVSRALARRRHDNLALRGEIVGLDGQAVAAGGGRSR